MFYAKVLTFSGDEVCILLYASNLEANINMRT